jgi:hypothetical protein
MIAIRPKPFRRRDPWRAVRQCPGCENTGGDESGHLNSPRVARGRLSLDCFKIASCCGQNDFVHERVTRVSMTQKSSLMRVCVWAGGLPVCCVRRPCHASRTDEIVSDLHRRDLHGRPTEACEVHFCQTDQLSTVVRRRSLSRSSMVSIRSSLRSRCTS